MRETYWIQSCLQVISTLRKFYLFKTQRITSSRESIDGLFRKRTPLVLLMQLSALLKVLKVIYVCTLFKPVFFRRS